MKKQLEAPLYLQIAGIPIQVQTNFPFYHDYLQGYYSKVLLAEKKSPKVIIRVIWDEERFSKRLQYAREDEDFVQVGTHTFRSSDKVVTFQKVAKRKKAVMEFQRKEDRVELTVFFNWKRFKDDLRYHLSSKKTYATFFQITYPILYYPLFWYLEFF